MLPELNRIRKSTTQIDVFRGLNRTANTGFSRVGANSDAIFTEFKAMKNLCCDEYPKLKTRRERSRVYGEDVPEIMSNLLVVNGEFAYITGDSALSLGGTEYTSGKLLEGEHTLTQYGNRLIIMPEKLYFDIGTKSFENIEVSFSLNGNDFGEFNTSVEESDVEYITSCSIEKVDLDEYDKPRKAAFKITAGIDLSNSDNQLPIDNNQHYKYPKLFGEIKEGETAEAMGASPGVLYKCYSIEGKTNYNSDNKLRSFIHVNNYYLRIKAGNLTKAQLDRIGALKKGDFIKLSNLRHSLSMNGRNLDPTTQANLADLAYDGYLEVLNGQTFKVFDVHTEITKTEGTTKKGNAWIVIKANIECSIPYGGEMTVERVMPELDNDKLIEVNNRLWGCSSEHSEIYSSKLGDCTNWQAYGDGISTDSFAATVGCEGDFTGIARQNDSVIFFKENWIIKLYGNKPSNFSTAMFNVLGVEKGSGKSIVWVNGVLYYLSPAGVCRYSPGGQPQLISKEAFGDEKYKNGVAGRHRNKYVISAQNSGGEWEMFVFDTVTGLWHQEDGTHMLDAVTYNDVIYYIDSKTRLLTCGEKANNLIEEDENFEQEGQFDWNAETGNLYDSDFNAKYISKLRIYAEIEENGYFNVLAKFKDKGAWIPLKVLRSDRAKPRAVDIAVRRSHFLRLRLEGVGQCRISGILIEYARGSGIR